MRYYFVEIKDFVPCSSANALAVMLKALFRPYTQAYHVQQRLTNLRMSAGGYLTYAERFIELTAQQRHLPQEVLLNTFLAGLTQEFRQQCMLLQVTSFLAAQDTYRAIHFATAATTAGSFQTACRSFGRRSPSSQRMRPTSPFSRHRSPFRSASSFRRTQDGNPFSSPHVFSVASRATSRKTVRSAVADCKYHRNQGHRHQ